MIGILSLSQVIEILQRFDASTQVSDGFGEADSWRGSYNEIAFTPKRNTTVGDMLNEAHRANDSRYEGYKGGRYLMTLDTPCHIAEWGCYNGESDDLTEERLLRMIAPDEDYRSKENLQEENSDLSIEVVELRSVTKNLTDELAAIKSAINECLNIFEAGWGDVPDYSRVDRILTAYDTRVRPSEAKHIIAVGWAGSDKSLSSITSDSLKGLHELLSIAFEEDPKGRWGFMVEDGKMNEDLIGPFSTLLPLLAYKDAKDAGRIMFRER